MKKIFLLLAFLATTLHLFAQEHPNTFTRADSLRGFLNPNRSCYNVISYDLSVSFDLEKKEIQGHNEMTIDMTEHVWQIQIDLFDHLIIDSIFLGTKPCDVSREYNSVLIKFPYQVNAEHREKIHIYYHGKPKEAANPPWEGGFVWEKDSKGNHWVSVACEGLGASSWWPNKDHLSDEPRKMNIHLIVPKGYQAISNGRLINETVENKKSTFHWSVTYPINNYNTTFYIGKYAHITDHHNGVDLDYYVLKKNKKKAEKHFEQVKKMLDAFTHYFGEYPYIKDGYKLVEAPYWGMEHQSAIAYGNNYKNNKWGFDFIILHESGHEWWGNHVSCSDHADLWIHEAFCTYSEALYVEYYQGKEASIEYLNEQKKKIENNAPIKGPYDVNFNDFGSADMYYKGSNMLHTLRTLLENDVLWFSILKGLQKQFGDQTTSSDQIIAYFNRRTSKNFSDFFSHYLNSAESPKIEYNVDQRGDELSIIYRYSNTSEKFDMPVRYTLDGKIYHWIYPKSDWTPLSITLEKDQEFHFDEENFMVDFVPLKK